MDVFDTSKWEVVPPAPVPAAKGGDTFDTSKWEVVPPAPKPAPKPDGWADDSTPAPDVPVPHDFHYDPKEAEAVEPGVTAGVQPSMIQPDMLLTMGGSGLATGGIRGALKALGGLALSSAGSSAAQPLEQTLPDTTLGNVGRFGIDVAAGMAPELIGGAALNSSPMQSLGRRFSGKQQLINEAQETAQRTLSENADEAEKFQQSVVATKTKAVQGAQESQAKLREAQDEANKQVAELERTTAKQLAPEAKQAIMRGSVGEPPPETMPEGPARQARDTQFRQALSDPVKQWRKNWGQSRDEAIKPHLETAVEDTVDEDGNPVGPQVSRAVAQRELTEWQAGRKPFGPKVQKLLHDTVNLGQLGVDSPAGLAKVQDILRKTQNWTPKHFAEYSPQEQLDEVGRLIREGIITPEQVKVKDLLTLQAQAKAIAASTTGADQTAAKLVANSFDDALAGTAPTDELKQLNAAYRSHRTRFPYNWDDKIRDFSRPVEVAPDLFNHPERTLDLVNMGDESTRRAVGQLYAQATANGTVKVSPEHQPFLAKVLPGTAFAKPDSWVYTNQVEDSLAEVVNSSPQVKAKWLQGVGVGGKKIAENFADTSIKLATRDLENYGAPGAAVLSQVRQAKTKDEAFALVNDFYKKLTPEAAMKMAMGAKAGLNLKNVDEEAVKALQRGYKPSPLMQRLKYRAEFSGAIGLGALMTGHGLSAWVAGSMTMLAGLALRNSFVKATQNALKDTAEAQRLWEALKAPSKPVNWSYLTGEVARASIITSIENAGADPSILDDKGDEPTPKSEPIPDPREKAPLSALEPQWRKAQDTHDTAQADEIKGIVTKRLKAGEFKLLNPQQKTMMARWMRDMATG